MADFDLDKVLETTSTPIDPRLSKEEWAERKSQERGWAFETSDRMAAEIGTDERALNRFLSAQGRFLGYSPTNVMLVLAQKPTATRLGDNEYWKDKGCYIKKGERGISILEPGEEHKRDDGSVGISWNVTKVFDVSQVDIRTLEEKPQSRPANNELLKALISSSPMPIEAVEEAYYEKSYRTDDCIYIRRGMNFTDTFCCLVVEIAGAHNDLFNECRSNRRDQTATTVCAAYILSEKYGTKDGRCWALGHPRLTDLEPQEIKGELGMACELARDISKKMERTLNSPQKEAKPPKQADKTR